MMDEVSTAVQVTVWLSEAGNYHPSKELAEADTLKALLQQEEDAS